MEIEFIGHGAAKARTWLTRRQLDNSPAGVGRDVARLDAVIVCEADPQERPHPPLGYGPALSGGHHRDHAGK
jgi:hypothetical protein